MRQLRVLGFFACLLSGGSIAAGSTVQNTNRQSQKISTMASSSQCNLPNGWKEVSRLNPKYVIFGEIHGTKEAPDLVGSVACALAKEGKRILVAVELGAPDDLRLQDAWQSPKRDFKAKLLKFGWANRDDGVASIAMLELLTQLHALKTSGSHISVVAFNGFRNRDQERRLSTLPSQEPHEAAQAENIRDAASRDTYDHVIVLVGAAHAAKVMIDHAGDKYKPMAMFLENYGKVVSLKMATAGGTAWNCTLKSGLKPQQGSSVSASMIECSNHPFKGLALSSAIAPLGLGKLPGMDDDPGYDGYFWLNSVSGSAPALP